MSVKKKKGRVPAKVVAASFVAVFLLAVSFGLLAKAAMDSLNRKMGIDPGGMRSSEPDSSEPEQGGAQVLVPHFNTDSIVESGAISSWSPGWKPTLCSLFVTEESEAIFDSLPMAPDVFSRPTELQLLVELWAEHSGFDGSKVDMVWVFVSGDSCFVDMPESVDWQALAKTIKGRFLAYSFLFPFVAGQQVEGTGDGIPVTGLSPL